MFCIRIVVAIIFFLDIFCFCINDWIIHREQIFTCNSIIHCIVCTFNRMTKFVFFTFVQRTYTVFTGSTFCCQIIQRHCITGSVYISCIDCDTESDWIVSQTTHWFQTCWRNTFYQEVVFTGCQHISRVTYQVLYWIQIDIYQSCIAISFHFFQDICIFRSISFNQHKFVGDISLI